MSTAHPVRLRVNVQAPLPTAQFVMPVRAGAESLSTVRTRIVEVLCRHHGVASLAPATLMLRMDDYQLLDEFGTEVLQDGDVVTYVPHSRSVGLDERPKKRKREEDVLAEAHRIASAMRSGMGTPHETPTRGGPQDTVAAAMETFAARKRAREAAQCNDTPQKPLNPRRAAKGAVRDQSIDASTSDASSSDSSSSATSSSDTDSDDSSSDDTSTTAGSSTSDESTTSPDTSSHTDATHILHEAPNTSSARRLSPDTASNASDAPSVEGVQPHDAPQEPIYVPPGQGKERTRRKNQRRRERQRLLAGSDEHAAPCLAPDTSLPPGGGTLDLLPAARPPPPASPPAEPAQPEPADPALEQIAARMLAHTTVGHRKRRTQRRAAPLPQPAAQVAELTPANLRRVPPPSLRPPEEIPEGMTISRIDCKAWYDEQWDAADAEATRAYTEMQHNVKHALEEEKRAEEGPLTLPAEPTDDPLRAALPQAFGRGPALSDADLVYEIELPPNEHDDAQKTSYAAPETAAPPLDYGPPEPVRAPEHASVLGRLRALHASVFGS